VSLEDAAPEALLPQVYSELQRLAAGYLRRERPDHTLQPTALLHEAYLRLAAQNGDKAWSSKTHFLAVGALAMRQVLVDHARSHKRQKRGLGERPLSLDTACLLPAVQTEDDILALEDALARLETLSPRQAKVVQMRFYGGLAESEIAEVLDISQRTVASDWSMARAWLHRQLHPD
jgi:RNA polymerase sigma factor (TIGR02999 family)